MKKGLSWSLGLLSAGLLVAVLLLPRLLSRAEAAPRAELRALGDGRLGWFCGDELQEDRAGLLRDGGRWYYTVGGLVAQDYSGFAENSLGWWYVERGLVDFERNALIEGRVDGVPGRWYVLGGMVKADYDGLSAFPAGEAQYVIRDGRLDSGFTGFVRDAGGWRYAEAGCLRSELTGLVEGELDGAAGLWLVREGRVQLDHRGLVSLDEGAPWCVSGGLVETAEGIFHDGDRAWLCRGGRVDTAARCAWSDGEGDWIVRGGEAVPVRSEEERTLFRAMRMVEELTDEGMSREEKLSVCFHAVMDCREYPVRFPHLQTMDWPIVYANDIFEGDGGNCLSFAAAFAYLASAIGYDEVYCCNSGSHGWAEIEGLIYDPEWSRHSGGVDFYALSYDSPMSGTYKSAMLSSVLPGYEWMHILLS